MKSKGKRLLRRLSGVLTGAAALGILSTAVAAGDTGGLRVINAGAAAILDADLTETGADSIAGRASSKKHTDKDRDSSDDDDSEKSNLVMANVKSAVNVRKEADEDSDKVGMLYSDCGGEVLERRNGWTKLKSGHVVGWTKDEYLLFDEQAEELAKDVGNLIVVIEADTLRIRKEPGKQADVWGLIGKGDKLKAIEEVGDDWISVEYEGDVGYISAQYAKIDFLIDYGETIEEIKAREKKEREEKEKAALEKAKKAGTLGPLPTEDKGAMSVEVSDEVLLAALIQCEAGGQPYEGQLAVGAVVMNRVRSGGYPNSIRDVIYASGQFTPALNGKVEKRIAKGIKESCVQAAQEAIAGASNVGDATHFRRVNGREGLIIGSHVFW